MTRFDQEFALVPQGARWTAVLVCLVFTGLMGVLFLVPGLAESDGTALLVMSPFFLLSLLGAAFLGAYVLLVGYVFGDAKRRTMNHFLWTLLSIFIPNAIAHHPVLHPARPGTGTVPRLRGPGEEGSCLLRRLRRRGAGRLPSVPAAGGTKKSLTLNAPITFIMLKE